MSQEAPRKRSHTTGTEPLPDGSLAATAQRRVSLIVHHRDGAEVSLLVPGCPLVVGRSAPSDLCVADRTLSREHARFTLLESTILVEDLGSTNGIRVAGERVERAEMAIGDEVILGAVIARTHALGGADDATGVEAEESFRKRLDEEAARARHFHRRFALLAVRSRTRDTSNDGRGGAWVEWIRLRTRPIDRLGAYSPEVILVLLPEMDFAAARDVARALASPEGDNGGACFVGMATFPDAAGTPEALIELALRAAARASAQSPFETAPTGAWTESSAEPAAGSMVGGEAMRVVLETAVRISKSRIPVILHGETGTGKEVLARLIHESGPRRERRLVRVNCAAIPATLVESTLFGHEKGAFTGAVQQQRGVFEEADKGTVFLDEIGELPLAAQAALLRVLETGSFARVGSTREVDVDVRVIAATHRDLEAMARERAFREDLYYRLSTMVLEIPPLRERADEIERLALHFLGLANKANGCAVRGIAGEALALLQAYRWPGNVRELKNAIERGVVVAQGEVIRPEDLPARVREVREGSASASGPAEESADRATLPMGLPGEARSQVKGYETRMLEEALRDAGGSRTEAAKRLGMPVRTLSYRMKVLGVVGPKR